MAHDAHSEAHGIARLGRVSVALVVQAACIASLISLALMVWSVLDPTPMPVMVSMSLGQVIGTIALLLYVCAVLMFQLRLRRERAQSSERPDRGR